MHIRILQNNILCYYPGIASCLFYFMQWVDYHEATWHIRYTEGRILTSSWMNTWRHSLSWLFYISARSDWLCLWQGRCSHSVHGKSWHSKTKRLFLILILMNSVTSDTEILTSRSNILSCHKLILIAFSKEMAILPRTDYIDSSWKTQADEVPTNLFLLSA